MYFYDARETKNLPSQKQRPVTWRPRVDLDSMNRDGGRQQSLCFSPGQINSRWPPPPSPPCRTKLIRKWRSLGEPLFRVDCTPPNGNGLLPPFSNLCISICSFSFPRVTDTRAQEGEDHEIAESIYSIENTTPPSNPFLNVFLSDRRKSRRFLVGSREIKGEKGRSWEGKVFGNWFSSVGLGDCFGFKEEMYFWEEVF